jgi:predicted RNase H-like HicB family nuclease
VFFFGSLNEYPDHHTRAYSKEELQKNLKDLLRDIEPYIRRMKEMAIAE